MGQEWGFTVARVTDESTDDLGPDGYYPYWLADRLEVPIEDVIWAAEEYARDYPFADLEPAPQPPADAMESAGNEPWVVVLLLAMIGLAVALAGGLVVYLLLVP